MKKFNIQINEQDIAILNIALGNMPYNQVVDFINRLTKQINSQVKPTENEEK